MRISDWSSDVCSSDLRRDLACHFALIWLDDLKHQLFRCVKRLTDFVIEPQSSGLQHMDRAEQINGRVLLLHHPEPGTGAGQTYALTRTCGRARASRKAQRKRNPHARATKLPGMAAPGSDRGPPLLTQAGPQQ